eukprot:TRINITY_DN2118_c0_g1_i1.p1 TRINITY_DN2118_c0_g1~~TRINITY_DN2118_c0_g1_i1.p1  ORF type:complete len:710 (+),score=138.22 TRINITY_DN2118_c0_g1_i1:405-2534(+)
MACLEDVFAFILALPQVDSGAVVGLGRRACAVRRVGDGITLVHAVVGALHGLATPFFGSASRAGIPRLLEMVLAPPPAFVVALTPAGARPAIAAPPSAATGRHPVSPVVGPFDFGASAGILSTTRWANTGAAATVVTPSMALSAVADAVAFARMVPAVRDVVPFSVWRAVGRLAVAAAVSAAGDTSVVSAALEAALRHHTALTGGTAPVANTGSPAVGTGSVAGQTGASHASPFAAGSIAGSLGASPRVSAVPAQLSTALALSSIGRNVGPLSGDVMPALGRGAAAGGGSTAAGRTDANGKVVPPPAEVTAPPPPSLGAVLRLIAKVAQRLIPILGMPPAQHAARGAAHVAARVGNNPPETAGEPILRRAHLAAPPAAGVPSPLVVAVGRQLAAIASRAERALAVLAAAAAAVVHDQAHLVPGPPGQPPIGVLPAVYEPAASLAAVAALADAAPADLLRAGTPSFPVTGAGALGRQVVVLAAMLGVDVPSIVASAGVDGGETTDGMERPPGSAVGVLSADVAPAVMSALVASGGDEERAEVVASVEELRALYPTPVIASSRVLMLSSFDHPASLLDAMWYAAAAHAGVAPSLLEPRWVVVPPGTTATVPTEGTLVAGVTACGFVWDVERQEVVPNDCVVGVFPLMVLTFETVSAPRQRVFTPPQGTFPVPLFSGRGSATGAYICSIPLPTSVPAHVWIRRGAALVISQL